MDLRKIGIIFASVFAGLAVLFVLGIFIYVFFAFRTYESEQDRLRMVYPKSWTVVKHPLPGALAAFVSPKENALDIFKENITVTFTDLTKSPMTLKQYAAAAAEQFTRMFPNVKVVLSRPMMISKRSGYQQVFVAQGNPPTVVAVYSILSGYKAYNVTYIGSWENYNKRDRWRLFVIINYLKAAF